MNPLSNTRVVLIGEAPGPRTPVNVPLDPTQPGGAGRRLALLLGLETGPFFDLFQTANLLGRPQGLIQGRKREKDRWPARDAAIAAQGMRALLRGRTVLFLGRRVASAFGGKNLEFFQWREELDWGFRYAAIPHTSGRSHFYGVGENRSLLLNFMRESFPDLSFAPGGGSIRSDSAQDMERES